MAPRPNAAHPLTMSTILNALTRSSTRRTAVLGAPVPTAAVSGRGARGLVVMLLMAALATLVLLAEPFTNAWTDDHLFAAWVLMWAAIFAGMALLAGAARALAARAMRGLDAWSHQLAQARAEARLWDFARSDPRMMAELTQARQREAEAEADDQSFDAALVPLGIDTVGSALPPTGGRWLRHHEALATNGAHRRPLPYL